MGAVRMRVQTAATNITVTHSTPVHRLTPCEAKRWLFVRNKSIKYVFNFKTLLLAIKYESSIHNTDSSIENVSSELVEKYAPYTSLTVKTVDFDVKGQRGIMESYFGKKWCFKVKTP